MLAVHMSHVHATHAHHLHTVTTMTPPSVLGDVAGANQTSSGRMRFRDAVQSVIGPLLVHKIPHQPANKGPTAPTSKGKGATTTTSFLVFGSAAVPHGSSQQHLTSAHATDAPTAQKRSEQHSAAVRHGSAAGKGPRHSTSQADTPEAETPMLRVSRWSESGTLATRSSRGHGTAAGVQPTTAQRASRLGR